MNSPTRSIRITATAAKALARIAAVTRLEPEDIVNASIGSVAAHVREYRSLSAPFAILNANHIPVLIDGELRKSLESAADKNGTGLSWLVRLCAEYGLKQLERGNFRIIHPGEEKGLLSTQTPSPPPDPPAPLDLPKLRHGLALKFAMVAEMLELHPQEFVNGIFKSLADDFLDPNQGLLAGYADNGIMYASPAAAQRVKRRVAAFDRRRARVQARRDKTSMGSGVKS